MNIVHIHGLVGYENVVVDEVCRIVKSLKTTGLNII